MEKLKLASFKKYLTPRARDAHKGDFGHVLLVGGDRGFSGAIHMAAEAALRVGAGLVTVATHEDHAAFLNLARPEIMSHGVDSERALKPLLERATVIVLGPGLGRSQWSDLMFSLVVEQNKPLILDADGLNILAENPLKKANWILTPHPGEAARLLKTTANEIQANRAAAVEKLQKQYDGAVILKGHGTLVKGREGEIAICSAGNPGMATAGMGDVLSGVLGGLLGQNIPLDVTAKMGVLIHATAGDLAAKAGERGMIATDLLPYLRRVVNMK